MTEQELSYRVLLSAQRALLGAITPNIRQISVEWNRLENLYFRVVYDSPPSEDDIDEMESVITQIVADVPFESVEPVEAIVSVAPLHEVKRLGRLIYLRKE